MRCTQLCSCSSKIKRCDQRWDSVAVRWSKQSSPWQRPRAKRSTSMRILCGTRAKAAPGGTIFTSPLPEMKPKICIVSSCGGHLTEVRTLRAAYDDCEHFYVINKRAFMPADMEGKTYFIRHSERDLLFFVNLWEAWTILRKEKP